MKKYFFLILLLFVIQSFSISGKVLDKNGNPIPNVIVTDKKHIVYSNETGLFYWTFSTDNDSLLFHKFGFNDICYNIRNVPSVIILEKKSYEIESFSVIESRFSDNVSSGIKKYIIIPNDREVSLEEIIQEETIIHVKGDKLAGEEKSLSILGNKTKHTLILLDGIPLNKNGESFDLSSIPSSMIEEIEIISHGASAIAGSGAIGGIVNLITKKKFENSFQYSQKIGSFSFHKERFAAQYANSKMNILGSVEHVYTKNDFSYQYLFDNDTIWKKRENNDKKSWKIFAKCGFQLENLNFEYHFDGNLFNDHLPGPTNQISKFDHCVLNGNIFHHISKLKFIKFPFNPSFDFYYFEEFTNFDNTKSTSTSYQISSETDYIKKGYKITLTPKEKINIFGEFYQEKYQYNVFDKNDIWFEVQSIPEIYRNVYSVSSDLSAIQKIFPFDFKENLMFRYDHFKDSKKGKIDAGSWRGEFSLGWEYIWRHEIGFIASESFSIPSFTDLYWKGDYQVVGNPDLEPEYSTSWQLFTKTLYKGNSIQFSFHLDQVENLIFWRQSISHWKPDNIGEAELKNFEIQSSLNPFSWFKLNTSWLRTFAIDQSSSMFNGKNLIYTPTSQTSVTGFVTIRSCKFTILYHRTGRQWITQDNLFGTIEPYEIVNTSLGYQNQSHHWITNFNINFNNIFDTHYEIYTRMPKSGFNWQIEVSIKYKWR